MATTQDKILGTASGASVKIVRNYTITPPGINIVKVYMTIEKRDGSTPGRVQKVITSAPGADGQITDANTDDGTISMFVNLESADTIQFEPHRAFPFDIQAIGADGKVYPLSVEGEFIPLRRSTVEVV